MADGTTGATGATVDTTKAPAKIVSVTELANGQVWVVTEAKAYQLQDGKLRPVIFADVEAETVAARSKPAAVGAVAAAPPPAPPPAPTGPPVAKPVTPTPAPSGGLLNQPPLT
jgi:hypothetical protein